MEADHFIRIVIYVKEITNLLLYIFWLNALKTIYGQYYVTNSKQLLNSVPSKRIIDFVKDIDLHNSSQILSCALDVCSKYVISSLVRIYVQSGGAAASHNVCFDQEMYMYIFWWYDCKFYCVWSVMICTFSVLVCKVVLMPFVLCAIQYLCKVRYGHH